MRLLPWICAALAWTRAQQGPSCNGKADGTYDLGCSSDYYQCSSQRTFLRRCQGQLVFDPDRNMCDRKFRVVKCGGHPEAGSAPVTRAPLHVPTYAPRGFLRHGVSGFVNSPPSQNFYDANQCLEVVDGQVANGICEREYTICVESVPQRAVCRSDEVFDSALGMCSLKHLVASCQLISTGPMSSPVFLDASPIDCSQMPDGTIFPKCARRYFECSAGRAIERQCPGALVFDTTKGYCEYAEQCGVGNSQRVVAAPNQQVSRPAVEETGIFDDFAPIPPPQRRGVEGVDLPIDCTHRENGNYGFRCWYNFTACSNGLGYLMNCPSRLTFDPQMGLCDYPEVNGCVGVPVTLPPEMDTTTMPAPTRTPEPVIPVYQPVVPNVDPAQVPYGNVVVGEETTTVTLPPTTLATTMPPFDCSDKIDGAYANGCSAIYFVCSYGSAVVRSCPDGLVFSPTMLRCERAEDCMMLPTTSTTPLPAVPIETMPSYLPPTPVETTTVQSYVPPYEPVETTTYAPIYYPPTVVESTPAPECAVGDVRSAYQCAFEFERCRGGKWMSARCPRGSMFDQKLRLCVFSSQECHNPPAQVSTQAPTTLPPPLPVTTTEMPTYGTQPPPYQPQQPIYQPEQTSYQTEKPIYQPQPPVYQTSPPVYQPEPAQTEVPPYQPPQQPVYQSTTPIYQPQEPTYLAPYPQEPSYQTPQPQYQTPAPVYQPPQPVYQAPYPQEPAYQPTQPSYLAPYPQEPSYQAPHPQEPSYQAPAQSYPLPSYVPQEPSFAAPPSNSYQSAQPEYYAPTGYANDQPAQSSYGTFGEVLPTPQVYYHHPRYRGGYHDWNSDEDHWDVSYEKVHNRVPYHERSAVVKKAHAYDDTFRGRRERVIPSDIFDVFRKGNPNRPVRTTTTTTITPTTPELPDAEALKLSIDGNVLSNGPEVRAAPDNEEESREKITAEEENEMETTTLSEADEHVNESVEDTTVEGSGVEEDTENDNEEVFGPRTRRSVQPLANRCPPGQGPLVALSADCHENFVFCADAYRPVHAACPEGETFDPLHMMCVESCGDAPSQDSPSVGAVGYGSMMASEPEVTEQVPEAKPVVQEEKLAPEGILDACHGRMDGPMGLGCSEHYIVCARQKSVELSCPEPLVFDERSGVCEFETVVVACGGTPAPEATTVSAASEPVMAMDSTVTSEPLAYVAEQLHVDSPMDPLCSEKADGFYAADCSGAYYSCNGGIALKLQCQEDLVFDEERSRCERLETVGRCSGLTAEPVVVAQQHDDQQQQINIELEGGPTEIKFDDDCAGRQDGEHATSACSATFLVCEGGRMAASLICPIGTIFDDRSKTCERREDVAECRQETARDGVAAATAPVYEPVVAEEQQKVGEQAEQQHYLPPHTIEQPSYLPPHPVEERKKQHEEEQSTVASSPPESEDSCARSIEAFDECSPDFRTCYQGEYFEQRCLPGLVYSDAIMACDYIENVPACATTTTTTTTEADLPVEVADDLTTTTEEVVTELVALDPVASYSTGAPRICTYDEAQPNFSTGYCQQEYGVCQPDGLVGRAFCASGELFDALLIRCVPALECGAHRMKKILEQMTTKAPATDELSETTTKVAALARCDNSVDGTFVPIGKCRSTFVVCHDGQAAMRHCASSKEVFSLSLGICAARSSSPECASLPVSASQRNGLSMSMDSPASGRFCSSREDGLYRDPSDCSAILQCMGGDLFEYPPCAGGLVFNELKKSCDFRDNVPECTVQRDVQQATIRGCERAEHGAFVPHESDCGLFYRCVWTRLELMHCPTGTVFNAKLDVCDWPSNVPECGVSIR